MAKNADICRVLFAALPDYYFKCKYCGTVRRQLPSSGYGNLMSHLKDKHAEYEADYLAHASSHAGTLHSFGFVNDKIANIYHWMEWVVDRNMPLSERAIAAIIPSIFGVMYDGWLCFAEHFVATYIVFWRDDQLHCVLLAMTPLDEADQTAASHVTFIRNILLTATMFDIPLVGCASHRFNLATERYLAEHEDLIGAVAALVAALRTPKNRAELRCHTPLAPLRANATRWSSTFMMLERYVRIRDAIKHVDAVDDLVPKPAVYHRIIALVENLKTFNSVCKKLQEGTISMSAVRVVFDKMTEIYPVTEEYLLPDAHIVHSPAFESAVVKVAGARGEELTPEELGALEPFELEAVAEPTPATSGSGMQR
uniref:BED-type domain-containing protein n=1 Tax=Phytophthora ramorum TaxID=164328 RepID=H3H5T9_PHYRM